MTTELLTQIKDLLTPLRWYTKEEMTKVAAAIMESPKEYTSNVVYENEKSGITLGLLSRYESIGKLPLTKEMLVCEMDKRWETFHYELREQLMREAQSKVLFEGFLPNVFTEPEENHLYYSIGGAAISWSSRDTNLRLPDGTLTALRSVTTIRDLTYHLSKYNETASTKIIIKPTEAFVKMICQNN